MYLQVEHFEDEIKDLDLFNRIYDKHGGVIEPYLSQIYFHIIECTLKKHSKRSSSTEVSVS